MCLVFERILKNLEIHINSPQFTVPPRKFRDESSNDPLMMLTYDRRCYFRGIPECFKSLNVPKSRVFDHGKYLVVMLLVDTYESQGLLTL